MTSWWLLGNETTSSDVTRTLSTVFPAVDAVQRVAITCAESFNDTVGRAVTDGLVASSKDYAQSLVPDMAEAADVTESRVNDVFVLENPVNGQ